MKRTSYWLASMFLLGACGSAPTELPPVEREGVATAPASPEGAGAGAGADRRAAGDPCAHQATGCPCGVEGEAVECGIVRQQFGDYVRCTPGFRLCHDGAWGRCAADSGGTGIRLARASRRLGTLVGPCAGSPAARAAGANRWPSCSALLEQTKAGAVSCSYCLRSSWFLKRKTFERAVLASDAP